MTFDSQKVLTLFGIISKNCSVKAPTVEAEGEENPAQEKWQEAHHAGDRDREKRTQQKAHAAQSQIPEDLWLR